MPDDVIAPVVAGQVNEVRSMVRGLTEAERRRLAPTAVRTLREVRRAYVASVVDKTWPYPGMSEDVLRSAQVLALATMTAAELKKGGRWALPPDDIATEVLTGRGIPLDDYVDAIADETPTRWSARFRLMRSFVRSGQAGRPSNPGYVLSMVNGLESRDKGIYEALREDPDLLHDEVWRLFEVEGAGESSLATHDKYAPEQRSWSQALLRLAEEELLPRERLLDVSLAALRRDFTAFRAGWFSRFHEMLKPTGDERRRRLIDYIALLGSPIPATVSFAVRGIAQAGGVPAEESYQLRPALESRSVQTVRLALALLQPSSESAQMVIDALPGAARDSQAELIGFLEAMQPLDESVRRRLAEDTGGVAAGFRERLAALAGDGMVPQTKHPLRATEVPRSVALPTLPGAVESLDQLVSILASLLEKPEHPYHLERALDGVSRLCRRDHATLDSLESIVRRSRQLLRNDRSRPFGGVAPRLDLANLVLAWHSGACPPPPTLKRGLLSFGSSTTPFPRRSVLGFLSLRVHEVAARASIGRPEPLLSLPTSAGGDIDPMVLGERRSHLRSLRTTPGVADAAQAALRANEVPAPLPVEFRFDSEVSSHSYQEKTYTHVNFHIHTNPPPTGEPSLDDVPGLFLHALAAQGYRRGEADYTGVVQEGPSGLAEAVRWVATVWPSHREAFYAKGAAELGQNIDWWEARWHVRHFMNPLLLPVEPVGEMARLLIALGLGAKEPGERGMASDVLVAALTEGRIDPWQLGDTLGRLLDQRVVKPARLASALGDISRISQELEASVGACIEAAISGLHGEVPADFGKLLGVLQDVTATTGRAVKSPAAVTYLSSISGTGKAATIARLLVQQAVE